jgi:hypothetical protein
VPTAAISAIMGRTVALRDRGRLDEQGSKNIWIDRQLSDPSDAQDRIADRAVR